MMCCKKGKKTSKEVFFPFIWFVSKTYELLSNNIFVMSMVLNNQKSEIIANLKPYISNCRK